MAVTVHGGGGSGGGAGLGAVGEAGPVRASTLCESIGNIMSFPFNGDALDKSGNHTLDSGSTTLATIAPESAGYMQAYTYDGSSMLYCQTTVGTVPSIVADSQAHQIALASPVSFGFFFMRTADNGAPFFMKSGPGSTASNYGVTLNSSLGWRFTGDGALQSMGDHREHTPIGRWAHIGLTLEATRNGDAGSTGRFYINGQEAWTGALRCSAPVSTHDFGLCTETDENDTNFHGWFCNAFLTDTVVTADDMRALSDEAFGHSSDYFV